MKKKKIRSKRLKKGNVNKIRQENVQIKKSKYFNFLGLGIIILLGILIYSNSFDCSFHLDDTTHIVENTKIRNLSDVKAIWNISQRRFTAYYSFAINYHFGELDVWGYHLFNLIIHLINAGLVYWLTLLIFSSPALKAHSISKDKKVIAFFTALLFVSHPLATQSVTYIVQRMASMVVLFYLLSLALYMKARLPRKSNLLKYALFAGSIICAVLAMLTKENAFTLPFAMLLVELCFFQTKKLSINFRDFRVILLIAGFLGFILIVLFNFSFNIFEARSPTLLNDYRTVTALGYLFTQFSVIVKYIGLLFLPINLNLDYDYPLSNSFFEIKTILSFLFLLSLALFAIFRFRKYRILSFGIFWFFLTLSIESSIIPIDDLIFEHRTYLPSFGFFLILSWGICHFLWNKYKYIAISVFALLIVSNSYLTYERNKVWKDDFTLWSDVISKSPNKARAYNGRGIFLSKNERQDEALKDYNKAIELSPNNSKAFFNRGTLFLKEKKVEEGLKDFNKAIKLRPNYVEAYVNRGNLLRDAARNNEAIKDYNKAIELNPNFPKAYNNRGTVFKNEKKFNQALQDYKKAIELDPNYVEAYTNRGIVYVIIEKYVEGIKDLNKAIELDPEFAMAYTSRGVAKLNLGDKEKSCLDFKKAVELDYKPAEEIYNQNCR